MLDFLFFAGLTFYFAAMLLKAFSMAFGKDKISSVAWYIFMTGALLESVYLVYRGVTAGRLPLSNQFEFATAFSWAISALLIFLHYKSRVEWIDGIGIGLTFMIISYAALQPREVTELMPALRSVWFGFHIGTAAISYASFTLAGGAGIRYLMQEKKNADEEELEEIDFFGYRLITVGELLLTVTIITGAIWAEEAWSAFWTWDPKEVWALITWILYAVYLHLRINKNKRGRFLAIYAIVSVPVVLFTFIGVNTLIPGLHSYGAIIVSWLI